MDTLICTYFELVVYDVNKSVLCFMEWLILSQSREAMCCEFEQSF